MPSLVLIDGGLGQLHAAADALESAGVINQPVASIAKREEIIYVLGREDEPIVLDGYSPVLHLVQTIRDEAHRFAVSFHRQRRASSRLRGELTRIAGVGPKTARKLLMEIGSLDDIRRSDEATLARVVGPSAARKVREYFSAADMANAATEPVPARSSPPER